MDPRLNRYVQDGQQQRDAVARSLVRRPGLILADGPFAAVGYRPAGEALMLHRAETDFAFQGSPGARCDSRRYLAVPERDALLEEIRGDPNEGRFPTRVTDRGGILAPWTRKPA